jgi:hypothetical protein
MSNANLLSRLEALTGPSREVDAEIGVASGTYQFIDKATKLVAVSGGQWVWPPRYTESLDAVLPTVPVLDGPKRGLWINLRETVGAHGTTGCLWHAEIWGLDGDKELHWSGFHSIPAIALLIAIERMRETSEAVK